MNVFQKFHFRGSETLKEFRLEEEVPIHTNSYAENQDRLKKPQEHQKMLVFYVLKPWSDQSKLNV